MNIQARIGSVAELDALRDSVVRDREKLAKEKKEIVLLCAGGGCIASGCMKVKSALEANLAKNGLEGQVAIIETGCMGPCAGGPILVMGRDKVYYQHVSESDTADIVERHILKGEVVERLTWKEGPKQTPVPVMTDIGFFKRQTKIVLRNCGIIDPNSIGDYVGRDGYRAIAKALFGMTPDMVIEEMKKSGLRGRGGAGFLTHLKWTFARQSEGKVKYVLCNADEGDPGAFMDRSVLEGDPHSVIEGMLIGAFAVGASQGYVYVRAEYPLAVERLQRAIEAARAAGLLGSNILGSAFSFDLEIRMGSGAFVCGEETALMASIEGRRGEPRPRPPFPAQKGLWMKPTVLNNVETFANVPYILLNGGSAFAAYGTAKSKGTKVFALAGAVNIAGLVEVPVGMPLGELVNDIAGGVSKGREFKAAQIGGPSGGCVPAKLADVPLDYESLNELGAIMGSGGLIAMDEDACMVDVARFFMDFVQEESCGKCVPCREGTRRMLEILNRICDGRGEESDIARLTSLGNDIKRSSLCGLGQTAPNPVLSTLRHFPEEYRAHIVEKKCPAGKCAKLVSYDIDPECCVGCTACAKRCPVGCIAGKSKEVHVIDRNACIRCGACYEVCRFGAVRRNGKAKTLKKKQ